MSFCREVIFDFRYLIEDLYLLCKHPTRKATYIDIKYHGYKLRSHFIDHPWYCLKRGIRNIFVWWKIIWCNDVFDYFYIEIPRTCQSLVLISRHTRNLKTWKCSCPGCSHALTPLPWITKFLSLTEQSQQILPIACNR